MTARRSHIRASNFFDAELVRAAASSSSTQAEAIEKLGLKPHADNYRRFREACARYGADVPGHSKFAKNPFRKGERHPGLADESTVLAALEGARNGSHAVLLLGMAPNGHNYRLVMQEAARLGVNISRSVHKSAHDPSPVSPQRMQVREEISSMSDAQIQVIVDASYSNADFLAAIHIGRDPRQRRWLESHLVERGMSARPIASIRGRAGGPRERDLSELFSRDSKRDTGTLKKRIIRDDLLSHQRCASCSMGRTWNDELLNFHLDHIDGDRRNNTLENLRFLCPNCHSQTDTYCKPKHLRLVA